LWLGILLVVTLLALYFVPRETSGAVSARVAAEFLLFGLVVGAYGTMVGAGGGFLIVPALLLVYHVPPEQAAGTSLAVVFLNALSGSISYSRQRRIDYRSGAWFAVATLPGAVGGAYLARFFTGKLFDLIFGIVMLGLAVLLVWRPRAEQEYAKGLIEETGASWWEVDQQLTDATGSTYSYRYNFLLGLGISVLVGFFSSILGLGGGIIHVPVLIFLLGFPPHLATATSHFILAISAGVGAASHLAFGQVLIGPAIMMGIGAVAGAQLGARLALRLQGGRILRYLSLALAVVGIRLLLR
jgi:hypothetical protein